VLVHPLRARRALLYAFSKALHDQAEHRAVQRIRVPAAETQPSRARPETPHPGVSVKA